MADQQTKQGSIVDGLSRLVHAAFGMARNRSELFVVELQEERYRLVELVAFIGAALGLALTVLLLLTGVIIYLFPADYRIWAALGLAVLYVAGIGLLLRKVKQDLAKEPFTESVNQLKQDWECLTPPK